MKRMLFAALAALALTSGVAHAQTVPYSQPMLNNPYQRPTFSPYLNLVRPGSNPALNYYGLVRPQLQTARTMQVFQQELQSVAGAMAPTTDPTMPTNGLPTTGHKTTFYNYGTYFPGAGGQNALGGGIRPTFGGMSAGRPQSGTLGGSKTRGR